MRQRAAASFFLFNRIRGRFSFIAKITKRICLEIDVDCPWAIFASCSTNVHNLPFICYVKTECTVQRELFNWCIMKYSMRQSDLLKAHGFSRYQGNLMISINLCAENISFLFKANPFQRSGNKRLPGCVLEQDLSSSSSSKKLWMGTSSGYLERSFVSLNRRPETRIWILE